MADLLEARDRAQLAEEALELRAHIAALTTAGNALDARLAGVCKSRAREHGESVSGPEPAQIEWRRVRDES